MPTPAQPGDAGTPLLEVRHLRVEFPGASSSLIGALVGRAAPPRVAVDDVSFTLARGTCLGLVGESGSGKSTVARAVLDLIPRAVASSREEIESAVLFEGNEVTSLTAVARRAFRRHAQIIFQDPAGSLNPRRRVRDSVAEPLVVHSLCGTREEMRARVAQLLDQCGLPGDAAERYPHEFSGGQRQRIAIARALASSPRLLVCDEPTSALDVSVQAQILNLLRDLQVRLGLSFLFITHDMGVVRHMCDRVIVMKSGRIVEHGVCAGVMTDPQHPYTRQLLAAALS